jgi:hypothetical protein
MKITEFKHLCNISLNYKGDCALCGITDAGVIYVEEDDDENWIRYRIAPDYKILQSGEIELPHHLIVPYSPTDHPLNYNGIRYRGMREEDRVAAWAQPLPLIEKMSLLPLLNLNIAPMLLLGIVESHITSEAQLLDAVTLVCRRVRMAYGLAQPLIDATGLPYDYDTVTLHVAHIYDAETNTAPPLGEALQGLGGIKLQRPLDCVVHKDRLIVADASAGNQTNQLRIYEFVTGL